MERRKDSKGRVLKDGESQRSNGKYVFKYKDAFGTYRTVESWRLVETDKLPNGKRQCEALRTLEKEIRRDVDDGIKTTDKTTVAELVEGYINLKSKRRKTMQAFRFALNTVKRYEFSTMQIKKVDQKATKKFLMLLKDDGKSYHTIQNIRVILKAAFQSAVEDSKIRKNPFNYPLKQIMEDTTVKKKAITPDQKKKLLDFLASDSIGSKHYDAIFILLNTGLRASEFAGLTDRDIDFTNKTLNIDKQLIKSPNGEYYISTPKTDAGSRIIPIDDDVCDAFRRIITRRDPSYAEFTVDGISSFFCFTRNGKPKTVRDWDCHFYAIRKRYKLVNEEEDPVSPHTFAGIQERQTLPMQG